MNIKRSVWITLILLLGTAVLFVAAPLQTSAPVAPGDLIPAGPILCLEAKNFGADLAAWNGSLEQRTWLQSVRYQGFSESRLYLRLKEAWEQFNDAAGFAADSTLLRSIAGRESALALYDIGDLAFVYITRLPSSRAMQTLLWQSRAKYDTRNAAGVDFYVRRSGSREIAFAAVSDWLIVGTREEYVAGTLRLLAHEDRPAMRSEAWYAQSTTAAGAPGGLRLTLNLDSIVRSPYFRSYWIQRNVSEIKPYWAAVADIRRTSGEIREDRVLLRRTPGPAKSGTLDIVRLAPEDSGFFQAWADPDPKVAAALIESKLFSPKMRRPDNGRYAPAVDVQSAGPGSEADLETRIDQPTLRLTGEPTTDALARFLAAGRLRAILQIGSARTLEDGVFTVTPAVIALESEQPWDAQAVQQALTGAAGDLWTFQGIGAGWTEHTSGARRWYSCDGLGHLHFAAAGNILLLASEASGLENAMARLGPAGRSSGIVYQASLRHAQEREGYLKITGMLDSIHGQNESDRWPFFSSDLASLSSVFESVTRASVELRDTGNSMREQVRYDLR